MKQRILLLTLSVCVCAASCVKEAVQPDAAFRESEEKKVLSSIVPGELIIQFDRTTVEAVEGQLMKGKVSGTGMQVLDDALAAMHATGIRRLYEDGGEWEERHRRAGLHQWYVVSYDDRKYIETKAGVSPLDAVPGIVYKEPVRRIKSLSTDFFNDPGLYQQWHYYNDGSKSTWKAGADINVLPVWENYTTGSKEIIVSVVDGGVDMSHEDLQGVIIPGGTDGSRNFYDNSYTITATEHGTHVAGTIAAINNNGIGVCGVAGGSDGTGGVKILNSQVFVEGKKNGGDTYNAMVWGADHGAVISQNSWGYVYDNLQDAQAGSVGSMKSAIDYFIKYAGTDKNDNQTGPMKGGVVIFAAGNDGWPVGWPGKYDGGGLCLAVGAMASNGTRSYYSNYGDWVDIAAPGGDAKLGPMVYSTVPGGYESLQGTSMACPHVSGVAALLVSYFGGPGFTNEMLVEKLLGGANTEFIPSSYQIGPLVDAYGAFEFGRSEPPAKVDDFTLEGTGGNVNFSWTVTSDPDNGKAYGYIFYVSTKESDFVDFNPTSLPSTVKKAAVLTGDLKVGDKITGNIAGLDFDTKYYGALIAYDYGKNYSELSAVKSVTTSGNNAPVFETSYTGDWKVKASQLFEVVFKIYDPDFHRITVHFSSDCLYATSKELPDGTYKLTIDGISTPEGVYTATYTAKDSYGAAASKVITFEVLPNHAPVAKKPMDNLLFDRVGQTLTLNIDEYVYDEDGDALTFVTEHTNSKVLHINPTGNILSLTSLSYGMDDVTIHAYDVKKAEAVFTFSVKVREPDAEADVYPSQVTDVLNISGGEQAQTEICIYNSTGQLVYEDTVVTDAFNPARIDVSGLAPGVYTVKVTIDGKQTVRTVVKL